VLIVDGEPVNLVVVDAILSPHGFAVHGVRSAAEVLPAMEQNRPDVVLLDVMLSGRDGFAVCRDIRSRAEFALTPIVFMTALGDREHRLRGLEAGADEFMSKPVDDVELLVRVRGFVERSRLQAKLNTTRSIVESLAMLVEARDGTTGDHCERLTRSARSFGESLGVAGDELEALEWAGVLHDIGKVGVPDAVLRKPGPLDFDEWELMQKHTTIGEGVVAPLEGLELVSPIVRAHHERWDGTGYPDGLQGESIPFLARVFQIVDIYDALVTERPYKRAVAADEALAVMKEESGSTCDPELFEHFAGDMDLHLTIDLAGSRRGASAPMTATGPPSRARRSQWNR
jgi:putative two-component system response regulator